MKHTKGPLHVILRGRVTRAGLPTYDIMHGSGNPENWDMFAERIEGQANADLISLAPTAPHDCDDPNCPGAVNKKRLEMFEEMAEVVKRFVDYYAGSKKSHLGNGQAYKSHGEMEILLAKIKED